MSKVGVYTKGSGFSMGKNELVESERAVLHKYQVQGTMNKRPSVNVVTLYSSNSFRHELMKSILALQLIKFGEITITDKVLTILRELEECSFRENPIRHNIITEAFSEDGKRRDLIDLTSGGEIFEVESQNFGRGLRHKDGINVIHL